MRLGLVAVCVAAPACSFSSASSSGPDGPPPPTIGFAEATSLQDENSMTVMIPVRLSDVASQPVRVSYSVTGGSAHINEDYTFTSGSLDFAPSQTEQMIPLEILPDGRQEDDETIEITLGTPKGAVLGVARHTLTISAKLLPRVNFALAASSASEVTLATTLVVTLDVPSPIPVGVDYTIGGTATAGSDFNLVNGTIVFPANTSARQLTLNGLDDAIDEDNETVVITLTNPANVVLGPQKLRTHTILDDDPEPTVSFSTTASSVTEAVTAVTLTVQLSAVSGKTVTVPFAIGVGTDATLIDDYSYLAMAALTFDPGVVTQTITINVVDDGVVEASEVVVTTLGTPTNATLVNGTQSHTLTITDND